MVIVGLDWARDKHELVIMGENGEILAQHSLLHRGDKFAEFAEELTGYVAEPQQVRVAIEKHDGALLAWLCGQGYTVYGINPKSAERARDRYRPGGGKDDVSDAFILADMLRTDRGYLQPLRPASARSGELRAWTRMRASLVGQKTAACQRLRAILAEWSPALSGLCNDLNRQWQRELLRKFPLHQDLAQATSARLHAFAAKQRLHGKTRTKMLLVRQTVILPIPPARQEVLRSEIRFYLDSLEHYLTAIAEAEGKLAELIENHPDAHIFNSLPCHGTATVATFLAAFGDDRENPVPWRQLAARWGAGPITIASGKSRLVKRRKACDQHLNQALIFFAFNTAFKPGCWACDYYQHKRQQGSDHYTTLRCLAQRWVKILARIWHDQVPYNEAIHQHNRQTHGGPLTLKTKKIPRSA